MDRKMKVAQYGCGKMSVYTMRYVMEKGAEIVAAFDVNPDIIGKDIGDVFSCDKVGVTVRDASEAKDVLSAVKPDICIVTTMSLMKDLKDILLLCAQLGINAITTCEEAFLSLEFVAEADRGNRQDCQRKLLYDLRVRIPGCFLGESDNRYLRCQPVKLQKSKGNQATTLRITVSRWHRFMAQGWILTALKRRLRRLIIFPWRKDRK